MYEVADDTYCYPGTTVLINKVNTRRQLPPVTADQIRTMRTRAKLSQGVFARYLNVSTGYLSQLERGVKEPSGAALALLNVIRRKGIEVIIRVARCHHHRGTRGGRSAAQNAR